MQKNLSKKQTKIYHDLSSSISSLAAGVDVLKKIDSSENKVMEREEIILLMEDGIKRLLKNWENYLDIISIS